MAKTKKTVAKSAKTTKTKAAATKKVAKEGGDEISLDRRDRSDRREASDRRTSEMAVAEDRRTNEQRRKTPRRRQIDPTTCERDYSDAEIEFMQAMDDYKRANGRMFPTCSEILEVLQKLGYQRVEPVDDAVAPVTDEVADDSPQECLEDGEFVDELELEQSPADEEI